MCGSDSRYEPHGEPSSVPLTISHAKIYGRTWRPQPADESKISWAKLNHQSAEVNTVTKAALAHMIDDPSKIPAHQNVELAWSAGPNSTTFTTQHRVVPGPIDSAGHGVSFTGDLGWTKPINDLIFGLNQFAAQQRAPVPRSFYRPSHVEPPSPWLRSQTRGRVTTQGFLSGAAVGRATTSQQLQERRRLQASERLVEARQLYAHQQYMETGDTREVLRAMDQTQAVAASALQHLAQEHDGADDHWWEV